ncbi:hypothetical protein Sango_2042400 [Sesamum angolense]|uniref:Aminotransferase-like plant mobile domain-containing protein n=1 Tax=Sesamum angolense TaxID=2727404 RepID=A0AAE2BP48_9LAMI|nr:hypothetical protein Sango_2042400 [Sesamum angolense]
MQYIGFAPEEGALKGSRLQVKSIISHISCVQITPETPHQSIVQYARVVALLLLDGTMCPDSSGNLVSLLYLAKLEDIVEARNYNWGSAVLAFLYRKLCNVSTKDKAVIGSALQLLQIWAWSRIIPLCLGLGVPRVNMGQHPIDNNCLLPAAPYGAMWNCEHTFTRIVRTTVRVIRDILDEKQYQPGDAPVLQIVTEQVNTLEALFQSTPVDTEGYRQLVVRLAHEVKIIKEAITHQLQQIATPSDTAPTTSDRERRSSSRMSMGSVERGDVGVDIVGPSTAYTPQDYYLSQPPQDYYVPQPSQDYWF